MTHFLLAGLLVTLPAAASAFNARYPAGSIRDAEQARTALKDADAEMARIEQNAKSSDAACYRGFFVNSCRDKVRREKQLAEREVDKVRLEARELQRRIDAEQVAKRREEADKARAAEELQRPQKEQAARDADEKRAAELKRRGAADGAPRAQTPGNAQDQQRPAQPRLSEQERAENVREFQQKQAQAEKHAQEKEAERKKNEERRAEQRKQLEQREAEREAIRKKAAETAQKS